MRTAERPRDRPAGAAVRPRRRGRARRGGERVLSDATDFPTLLSAAAHDIRSPLAAAAGFALTLQRLGGLDDRQERFVAQIVDACTDVDRLVDDLGLLARIHDGRFEPVAEPTTFAELAERAAAAAPPSTDGRRVAHAEPAGDGPTDAAVDPLARAIGRLAGVALRLGPRAEPPALRAVDGGVELAPLAPDAASGLAGPRRDLALAAARAAIAACGWRIEVDEAALRATVGPG